MKTFFLFFIFLVPYFCSGQISVSASTSATIVAPQVIENDSCGNILIYGEENQIYSRVVYDSIFLSNDSSKVVVIENIKEVHAKTPRKLLLESKVSDQYYRKRFIYIIYE